MNDNTLLEHADSGAEIRPTRLAFLISGSASHVLAVRDAIRDGVLRHCEIAIVVCNIPGAKGAEDTRAAGLQTVTMEGRGREQRDHEDAIDALLRRLRVDIVCMAGYLRTLSSGFLRQWEGRVLGVHASLLPAFARSHPVEQALEYGVHITGCTVFLLNDSLDGGAIVAQRVVEIDDDDTTASLSAKLLLEEHRTYITALERYLSGQYEFSGRRFRRTPQLVESEA
ncbi:MAG: formyltransferase family protein [Acidobacteriaceae bacterium]|nr:formyltransferase family protein [Acidobacteriaceae bacterium]